MSIQALPTLGAAQNFFVGSADLLPLGWLPQNGGPGQAPVNTDAAQGFGYGVPIVGSWPYPPTIGWLSSEFPLMDIWRFGYGITRLPMGPYLGGDRPSNFNGMEWGTNSSPFSTPQTSG